MMLPSHCAVSHDVLFKQRFKLPIFTLAHSAVRERHQNTNPLPLPPLCEAQLQLHLKSFRFSALASWMHPAPIS
jgi:hypothetical protein